MERGWAGGCGGASAATAVLTWRPFPSGVVPTQDVLSMLGDIRRSLEEVRSQARGPCAAAPGPPSLGLATTWPPWGRVLRGARRAPALGKLTPGLSETAARAEGPCASPPAVGPAGAVSPWEGQPGSEGGVRVHCMDSRDAVRGVVQWLQSTPGMNSGDATSHTSPEMCGRLAHPGFLD